MNKVLLKEVVELEKLLELQGINSWIYGSFAISLYDGEWIKEHDDVDLAFDTFEEYKDALRVASEHGYIIEKEFSWNGRLHEGLAWNAVALSANGGKFDFSFIKNEVDTVYEALPRVEAFGHSFSIFSLSDLQRIYEERGEKADDPEKIEHLKKLQLSR